MLQMILNRFREPSSFAGFSFLFTAAGLSVPEVQAVTQLLAGIAAALAVFLPERVKTS